MNFLIIKALLICAIFSGCAQIEKQIPYEVNKVVDQKSKLLPIAFPLGVSQERLAERQYLITAKLGEYGTHQRAKSMALYHSALLAENKGYSSFILNDLRKARWCTNSKSRPTQFIRSSIGGPTVKLLITLADAKQDNNRIYVVEKTKLLNKAIIDKVPTDTELAQISTERIELCRYRAKNRSKKR